MLCLVAANKDGVPGANKENAMHNPAYNISAALTYATQLVNVLAYYVNVRLPYKLTCGCVSRVIYALFIDIFIKYYKYILHKLFAIRYFLAYILSENFVEMNCRTKNLLGK